ncbi:hypothetical protein ABKN59_005145 [Abortiporus biennis]
MAKLSIEHASATLRLIYCMRVWGQFLLTKFHSECFEVIGLHGKVQSPCITENKHKWRITQSLYRLWGPYPSNKTGIVADTNFDINIHYSRRHTRRPERAVILEVLNS